MYKSNTPKTVDIVLKRQEETAIQQKLKTTKFADQEYNQSQLREINDYCLRLYQHCVEDLNELAVTEVGGWFGYNKK